MHPLTFELTWVEFDKFFWGFVFESKLLQLPIVYILSDLEISRSNSSSIEITLSDIAIDSLGKFWIYDFTDAHCPGSFSFTWIQFDKFYWGKTSDSAKLKLPISRTLELFEKTKITNLVSL